MILPSPWLCGSSVVNMSSGTREFGKCVKTQLQLVCSNYGSGEFVTTSLLIKRDFLIWINVIYKGKFQSSRRRLLRQRAGSKQGWGILGLLVPPSPHPGQAWRRQATEPGWGGGGQTRGCGQRGLCCHRTEQLIPLSGNRPPAKVAIANSFDDCHKRVNEPISGL